MKKSILYLLACFLITSFFNLSVEAQDTENEIFNNKKTEVNIAVANIFAKNNLLYSFYYFDNLYYEPYIFSNYNPQPELVVGVKFHNDKGAFRLGTNLAYSNITSEDLSGPTDKYVIKKFSSALYFGYEWHSTFNRVNIYYGFDISSSYNNTNVKNDYVNTYPQTPTTTEYVANEITMGINPLLGVNVFITPNLSIGTEFKFTTEFVSGKTKEITNDFESDETKSSGFRTRFGPLGFLSVNIHF